jgi:hypothetical protein
MTVARFFSPARQKTTLQMVSRIRMAQIDINQISNSLATACDPARPTRRLAVFFKS